MAVEDALGAMPTKSCVSAMKIEVAGMKCTCRPTWRESRPNLGVGTSGHRIVRISGIRVPGYPMGDIAITIVPMVGRSKGFIEILILDLATVLTVVFKIFAIFVISILRRAAHDLLVLVTWVALGSSMVSRIPVGRPWRETNAIE